MEKTFNPLDNIRVVLVGTLYTGNVGSACRAMANMGIKNLYLAAPNLQNSWDEGERMAVQRQGLSLSCSGARTKGFYMRRLPSVPI